MSDKKRTTVTTIETHEVWIIRKAGLELSEVEVVTPDAITRLDPFSTLDEGDDSSETSKEQKS